MEIPNHLSALLVAELVVCARKAQAKLTDPAERWERLREFLQTLIRVRRQGYLAGKLAIDLELGERNHEKEKDEDEDLKERRQGGAAFSFRLTHALMADLDVEQNFTSPANANAQAESPLRKAKLDGFQPKGSPAPVNPRSN